MPPLVPILERVFSFLGGVFACSTLLCDELQLNVTELIHWPLSTNFNLKHTMQFIYRQDLDVCMFRITQTVG